MLGRLDVSEVGQSVLHDLPEKQAAAIMSKLDELIVSVQALCAKLDADGGVTDTDYAATVSASLKAIQLSL